MKRLSDYKGNEAIELWADLLEPASVLLADPEIQLLRAKKVKIAKIAAYLLKEHSNEVSEILLRIDPEPITAVNAIIRFVSIIMEVLNSGELSGFFELQGQMTENESSGSATVNIADAEN